MFASHLWKKWESLSSSSVNCRGDSEMHAMARVRERLLKLWQQEPR